MSRNNAHPSITEKEKQMLPLLLHAANLIEDIYWQEAFGNKEDVLVDGLDKYTEKFINLNQKEKKNSFQIDEPQNN